MRFLIQSNPHVYININVPDNIRILRMVMFIAAIPHSNGIGMSAVNWIAVRLISLIPLASCL